MAYRVAFCIAIAVWFGNSAAQPTASREIQQFPNKPIRFVVPFPAGGANNVLARLFAQQISEHWGQQVVVDNRPGAGSIIGSEIVAKAPPDGYTILIVGQGYVLNPSLYEKLPYDTIKDFARVAKIAIAPSILVVHPSVPARNIKELIALAKATPGGLTYASPSVGSNGHLSMELLKHMAGVEMVHVPYKGGGDALTALIGGQVQQLFTAPGSVIQHVKAGRVRVLGISSATRIASMPEVPAIAETLPGYEVVNFHGVLAPARTPKPIVDKLNAEFVRILQSPDIRQRMEVLGFEPISGTPEEFTASVIAETAKFAKLLKDAGIKPM
jgi:tripartite-type tricarboxylate transporter receptor subunit TctC